MAGVRSADGTQIAYSRVGSGPAVILVDGSLAGRSVLTTAPGLEELLAPHCTVYRYDRRGRGDSDAGPAPAPQAEIEDLHALIDQAGSSATLCGFSSGAVLALEAARAGLAITTLVLQEPPFVVTEDRPALPSDYRDRLQHKLAVGDRDGAVALHLTDAVGTPTEYLEDMRSHPSWEQMKQAAGSLPYDDAVMGDTMSGDPATLSRFAIVTTPTLVLHGTNTEPWITAAAHALVAVQPNAHQDSLDGQDHMVAAEAIAPALLEFLGHNQR